MTLGALLQLLTFAPGASAAPSRADSRFEAEAVAPATSRVDDRSASGGAAVKVTDQLSMTPALPAGQYLMTARMRGVTARVRIELNGERVAAFDTRATWGDHSFAVRVTGPADTLSFHVSQVAARAPFNPIVLDVVSARAAPPGFTTRGSRILDPEGQPFRPRGVVRGGLQMRADDPTMSEEDVEWMRRWGANTVLVKTSQHWYIPEYCTYEPAYAERVDRLVRWITSRGMVAIIQQARSTQGKTCGVPATMRKMADELALPFWRTVASRYKSNPLVAFDLFNEPNGIDAEVWRDGGDVGGWRAVGMQQMYDAVRATGAQNLVFVSGTNWAYDIRHALTWPISGYGLVFAPHTYCLTCEGALRPTIDDFILPVAAEFPVVVTEFGFDQDSGDYNRRLIAWAERNGIGWVAFQWFPFGHRGFALLKAPGSYQPSALGVPVRDALWTARGWTTYG